MISTNKLNDPNLSEEEADAIIGAFVRQRENALLRQRWENKLGAEHDLPRPAEKGKRGAVVRRIALAVLSVAAALLLLLVVLPNLSAPSGEALLATYLEEAVVSTNRSTTTAAEIDSLRVVFLSAYVGKQYEAAVSLGEEISGLESVTATDSYNLGLAQLQAGDAAAAAATFESLLTSGLATEARFYLGLALLQAGDTEAALTVLNELSEDDGVLLYEKAQQLINAAWE